jgi:hypothetical protein
MAMKTVLVWCGVVVLALAPAAAIAAQSAPKPAADEAAGRGAAGTAVSPALVGSWKARPETTALATEFDVSVWGKGAAAVRDVALTVAKSGEATLTVTRKVVDARGRAIAASTSIEEARLVILGPRETTGPRIEHGVKVVSAQRRFPDEPNDVWTIEGLRVRVVSFADNDRTLEVRFDPPDGRGAFWQILSR